LFDLQSVTITQNIPDYLVSGNVYDVDFVINKGDIGGFAKFQMDIPDGINVLAVETKNSSFTFKSNVVKNIWMKVPDESEILLSYKFEVSPNFQGNGTIKARFVFIQDNERVTIAMEPKSIKVGDGSEIAGVSGAAATAFTPDKLKINRTIKALGNNEFDVNIIIEKDGLVGFAKIQDILPEGFEARPMRTSKSVFSIVENKVKFIWFNIPQEETIEISYILASQYPVADGVKLNGSFNYLYNDEARQLDFKEENLADYIDRSEAIVQNEPEEEVVATAAIVTTSLVVTNEEIKEEPKEEVFEEIVVIEEPEEIVEPVKEIIVEEEVVPQTSIFYRVQLAAGKRNVNIDYIKKKYGFNNEIFLENHQGWYKYTTGNFSVYGSARDRREQVKQLYKFNGPFVIAYNAGERITVQEALLISKQKWIK
jgi:hypothetical protein